MQTIDDTVSRYLKEFKQGQIEASEQLVCKYWPRVVAAASMQLNASSLRILDGEDVAVSVFAYLFQEFEECKFSHEEMSDRNDLWRHLSRLIASKSIDFLRRERAKKRGGGEVVTMSALRALEKAEVSNACTSLTPIEHAIEIENRTKLLESLHNDEIREIVVLRLEGYSQSDIARRMNLSERTIRRKLKLARQTWANHHGESSGYEK